MAEQNPDKGMLFLFPNQIPPRRQHQHSRLHLSQLNGQPHSGLHNATTSNLPNAMSSALTMLLSYR